MSQLTLANVQLIAFNIGWAREDITLAVYTGLGGTALTFLLVVPPWPIYNKKPVKFLPAGEGLYKAQ
jgi:signal peptidase complex subunit 1